MGTRATTEALGERRPDAETAATLLQWEYGAWRRAMGLDPPAETLNRGYQRRDRLGEALGCD